MTEIDYRFRIRRGTALELALVNEIPLESEIVIESDTGLVDGRRKIKIGDGVTHWNDLPYFIDGGGGGGTTPYRIPAGSTYIVPDGKQVLWTYPISIQTGATLDVRGVFAEVR